LTAAVFCPDISSTAHHPVSTVLGMTRRKTAWPQARLAAASHQLIYGPLASAAGSQSSSVDALIRGE
jgi:hypothetical protein